MLTPLASKKKLNDLITPTLPVKYCKHPGGAETNIVFKSVFYLTWKRNVSSIPAKPSLQGICDTRIFQLRAAMTPATKLLVIMVSMMGWVLLYPIFKYTIDKSSGNRLENEWQIYNETFIGILCCPPLSPQMTGTGDVVPVTTKLSVTHRCSTVSGWAMENDSKSKLNK